LKTNMKVLQLFAASGRRRYSVVGRLPLASMYRPLGISPLWTCSTRGFAGRVGGGWSEYKGHQAKFAGADDHGRAQYDAEVAERTNRKLNWNIKNRWEQRALDELMQNEDVKSAHFRDFTKISQFKHSADVQEFSSVDEIYYFMENMFTDGFDEHHISIALDVFLRDVAQFQEEDLESPTFKMFLRQLGLNMVTFTNEKSYIKTVQFLDWYCTDDKLLWVNLEQFLIRKEKIFTKEGYIKILNHFSNQSEGSRDFYDFFEFQYNSKVFEDCDTKDIINIAYAFYQVHAGTVHFFERIEEDLNLRLNDRVTTFNLLKVLQAFSEISSQFPKLFVQLETLFLKRLDQMSADELTCCACGFAISGFGTPFMFSYIEQNVMANLDQCNAANIKEVCRAFVFSMRGSKQLHQVLMPRIQQVIHTFSCRELCYMVYGFHKAGFLPKPFAAALEGEIVKTLRDVENVELNALQLMTKVFCRTRAGSREFHKLLETVVLTKLDEIQKEPKLLHAIGYEFETSGLCSLDVLKVLKKRMFQLELEHDVFES